ncbi:hypothetical protein VKT23_008000 [Stygiomarasmius scandens]|uniref:HMG box domain-containing protein n=1 Tax=Marasmiellus scandens TaxID=2682957 RepID=A0ABR1JJZ9_9AGAR
MCWKKLPPSERAEWEEKARIAQEEHRLKYPDWRFRPSTNTGPRRGKRGRRGGFSASDDRGRGVRPKGKKDRGVGDPGGEDIDPGGMGSSMLGRTSKKRPRKDHDDEEYHDERDEDALSHGEDQALGNAASRTRVGSSSKTKGKGRARATPRITVSIPDVSSPSSSSGITPSNAPSASTSGLASTSTLPTSLPSTSGSSVSEWRISASPSTSPLSVPFAKSMGPSAAPPSATSSTSVIPPQSSASLSPYASLSPSPSTSATPPTTSPTSSFSSGVGLNPDGTSAGPTTPEHSDNAVSEPERGAVDDDTNTYTSTSARSRRPRSSTVPAPTAAESSAIAPKGRYTLRTRRSHEARTGGRGRWNSNPAMPPTAFTIEQTGPVLTAESHSSTDPDSSSNVPVASRLSVPSRGNSPSKSRSKEKSQSDTADDNQGPSDTPKLTEAEDREKEREKDRNDRRIQRIAALLQEGKVGAELEQAMDVWDEEELRRENLAQNQELQGDVGVTDNGKGREKERSLSPSRSYIPRSQQVQGTRIASIEERDPGSRNNHLSFDSSAWNNSDSDTDTETLRGRAGGDWSLSRESPVEGSGSSFGSRFQSQRQQELENLPVPVPSHMNSLPAEHALPLTSMFKRSLSEPASGKRVPFPVPGNVEGSIVDEQHQIRQQESSSPNILINVGPGTVDVTNANKAGVGVGTGVGAGHIQGQEENSSSGFIWPPPPSPLPAHAASVPDPRTSPRVIPPNAQRAYTHPDAQLHAYAHPVHTHPPFASSPLSLSPGSPSPPPPSSAGFSSQAFLYGFPSATAYPEQINELEQQQRASMHHHYPAAVHGQTPHQPYPNPGIQQSRPSHRQTMSMSLNRPNGGTSFSFDPGMSGTAFPTRTVRGRASYSHLGHYRGEEYHNTSPSRQQQPPPTPSPQPPPTPELRHTQETGLSQSSYTFPTSLAARRGSIVFPIGSSSTSRSSSLDVGMGGIGRGRHRRSLTWQEAEQLRREEIDAADDTLPPPLAQRSRYIGTGDLGNALQPDISLESSVVDSEMMAKYKYPPLNMQEMMSTENMGYIATEGSEPSSQVQAISHDDGSQSTQWSNAPHGRMGLVNAIIDSSLKTPNPGLFSVQPPSTYSTLSGWDGDTVAPTSQSYTIFSGGGSPSSFSFSSSAPLSAPAPGMSVGQPVMTVPFPPSQANEAGSAVAYDGRENVWTGYTAYDGRVDGVQPLSIVDSGVELASGSVGQDEVGTIHDARFEYQR